MELLKTVKSDLDIRRAVLELAQTKGQIIHGARATNEQLPVPLRKKTKDYDVYTKKPEMSANELANRLNKEFGNGFKVVPGIHKGTFKVKRGEETIADYTRNYRKPKVVNKFGVKYADIDYAKSKLKKLVRSEATEFRRDKDLDTLRRIREGGRKLEW